MNRNRGSTPTTAQVLEILEEICAGKSVSAICLERGHHQSNTSAVLNSETWKAQYAHAQEERGHHYGSKVADVADGVLRGDYAPDVARVAMDGYKWTAARMAPKSFGDKQQVDVSGKLDVEQTTRHVIDPRDLDEGQRDALRGILRAKIEAGEDK